ncbi:MAG: biotin/lipoyl-binding protein [Microthrixaceae bacterium]
MNVAAGDTVTAGQVLATIDSAELEVRAAAAQADLADAEAELDTAEQLDRATSNSIWPRHRWRPHRRRELRLRSAGRSDAERIDRRTVTSVDLTVGEDLGASGTGGTTVTGSGTGSGLTSSQLGTRSNSTNYRVTIGLLQPDTELASGTTASVQIVTAAVRDALAVPSSAVHVDEAGASVTVERDGAAEEVRVQIGVTGSDWIEITSGLTDGDVVVLADLSEPLPGSDDDTTSVEALTATDFPFAGGGPPPG